ncbi:MAG: hypothetical protein V8R80_09695 [Eubacterium sp.]
MDKPSHGKEAPDGTDASFGNINLHTAYAGNYAEPARVFGFTDDNKYVCGTKMQKADKEFK